MTELVPPVVSVVMPVYRHSGEQLRRAIRSILDQTYPHFELIIVDGRGDEINQNIIRSFEDPRIRYFRAVGYIQCLNMGLSHCRGAYVARMDSDDISYPERLAYQVAFMQAHPEVDMCSCRADFFGPGCRTHRSHHRREISLINLIRDLEIVHPTILFRREIGVRYNNSKPTEDCLLFRRLLLSHRRLVVLDKVLYALYASDRSIGTMYPDFIEFSLARMNVWALAQYIHYPLSFRSDILSRRRFTSADIRSFLRFVYVLQRLLPRVDICWAKRLKPYYRYMQRHTRRPWVFVFTRWYYLSYLKVDLLQGYKALIKRLRRAVAG